MVNGLCSPGNAGGNAGEKMGSLDKLPDLGAVEVGTAPKNDKSGFTIVIYAY